MSDNPYIAASSPSPSPSPSEITLPASDSVVVVSTPPVSRKGRFQLSSLARIYLVIATCEAIFLLIDRILSLIYTNDHRRTEMGWWFGLMMINITFFLYLCWSALRKENVFELGGFLMASLLSSLRVILDFIYRDASCGGEGLLPWCITVLVVHLMCQVWYLIAGYRLGKRMGWKFYKEFGTNLQLKHMFTTYQAFQSTLKLDLQMTILLLFTALYFSITKEVTVSVTDDERYASSSIFVAGIVIACIALLFEWGWEMMGWYSVRAEHARWFKAFLILSFVCNPAYILFFLINFGRDADTRGPFIKLIVLTCLFLINRIALIISSWYVYQNFGRGMKQRMFLSPQQQQQHIQEMTNEGKIMSPRVLRTPVRVMGVNVATTLTQQQMAQMMIPPSLSESHAYATGLGVVNENDELHHRLSDARPSDAEHVHVDVEEKYDGPHDTSDQWPVVTR